MKLIFIRHAEPDYSIDSLTEKGWKEAKLLAERVKTWDNITEIYCSPLGRAKDTASFSLKVLNMEAVTYDWLKEFYYRVIDPETGNERIAWDFMPRYITNHDIIYDKDKWIESEIYNTPVIREKYKEVIEGIDSVLAKYGYKRDGKMYKVDHENDDTTLVFFCHLGVSFLIYSYLLGISPVLLWHTFFVAPTSVTCLGFEERIKGEGSFRVQFLGDTTHLHDAGEPISSSGYFTNCFQK